MQPDLVIRARDGDREAFSQLAAASFDPALSHGPPDPARRRPGGRRRPGRPLSAWVHIRAVREPERFEAWLRRLLVHACYREARRAGRRRIMENPRHAARLAGDRHDLQGATALRDQLERGLGRLTTDQRAVLVVHHWLGLA